MFSSPMAKCGHIISSPSGRITFVFFLSESDVSFEVWDLLLSFLYQHLSLLL